jgi:ATPase family associated with various cellular activities (AAA)/Winged helix domain, variant
VSAELDLELARARALARRQMAWLRATWPATGAFAGLAVGHEEADRLVAGNGHAATFLDTDPAATAATDEVAAATRALDDLRTEGDAPLAALAAALGLAPAEHDVLALAVCAELDPGFARLCAYLQDDATRPHLSPRLAWDLLAPGERALGPATAQLTARGRLRSLGLVRIEGDGPWAARALRVDERVLAVITGDFGPDPRVAAAVEPLAAGPLPARLDAAAGRAAGLAVAAAERGAPAVVALAGEATAPLHAVAAATAARLGLTACLLRPERLHELATADAATLLEREAVICRLAYVLEEPLPVGWPPLQAQQILVAREPPAEGIGARVDVATPTHAERCNLLRRALGREVIDAATLERIAGQFPLAPETLAEAVASARAEAAHDGGPLADAVWRACRIRARRRAPGLAAIVEPRRGWDDLVLPDPLVRRLEELAAQVAQRPVVYERWGFGERLGRGRGITALFAGPSGTGKTLAAEVLAGALRIDLQRIDLSGVVDKYIGETEKHLRAVFDAAERSGALLFFDEADALFGKRTDVRDSHDRYANIEVDYLLQRMEDYPGLAVLATNRKTALDPAFLRRLRFVLDFPFPDVVARRRIWEQAFPTRAPTADLDLDAIARLELSGGSIATVAVNAAFAAAGQDAPVGMGHVAEAARAELAKLERLVRGGDLAGWLGQTA